MPPPQVSESVSHIKSTDSTRKLSLQCHKLQVTGGGFKSRNDYLLPDAPAFPQVQVYLRTNHADFPPLESLHLGPLLRNLMLSLISHQHNSPWGLEPTQIWEQVLSMLMPPV